MPEATTIGAVLAAATGRLKQADVAETPRLEAILLLAHASGLTADRIRIAPEATVTPAVAAAFELLVQRRLAHEPVSKIVGSREFWSLTFRTSPDVLDPRPDSETLVAGVLAAIPDRNTALRLVDFGTGSGCLLLSLLHELPNATGLGIDVSPPALKIAQQNADTLGLAGRAAFRLGSWGKGVEECFDILIANPPYIESGVVPQLEPEVADHDPLLALDGGADGLDAYRALVPDLAHLAAKDALVALEVGMGQDVAVSRLLATAGFGPIAVLPDLGGIGRVVTGRKSVQIS
ncbi:MAG: peptide chain release factor N(5)-glutamine methyltransferase [Ferrovibrio sp.]|uniref:peptide chain release factor N(5)-glutamine methyltransferase n=1 Tax=Ferrovibrio sp. TaxID=1917215 RepID=UPI00260D8241|nr:peptide chain release factor N(5)-glutamine methyltransferase [Ferrovibrio sp.]MCW0233482.1 peptide chain release factor N(5)-glutamine methyltransferase [Ferrovibrio sp.]